MKLIELMSIITDYTLVRVFDDDGEELARYDGMDSIPEKLNDKEVERIFPADTGQLNIFIHP